LTVTSSEKSVAWGRHFTPVNLVPMGVADIVTASGDTSAAARRQTAIPR
jgi:hypothetical protein